MAKKRVEQEVEAPNLENIKIDTTPVKETYVPQAPENVPEQQEFYEERQATPQHDVVNCLRNERIVVKFVESPNAMVRQKGHVLSGGMSENAVRVFVVPLLRTGGYVNVLTKNEKEYLEEAMGLEPNALNVYRQRDNFWDDSNPKGIGKVVLRKQNNYLDLSNPVDYIKYKILLANKDYIASSLQELEERPKATYQFVIISENAEAKSNLSKMDATMQSYMEFGAVKEDKNILRTIIEILDNRPTSPNVQLDWLQGKMKEYIDRDPRKFLRTIQDVYLPAKVLIKRGIEAGLISWRNNLYYLKSDGSPLCEMGEESTLNNAARFISSPKNQELKFTLEAKLKEYQKN